MLKHVFNTAAEVGPFLNDFLKSAAPGLKIDIVAAVWKWSREVLLNKYTRACCWTESSDCLSVRYASHTISAVPLSRRKGRRPDVLIIIREGLPEEVYLYDLMGYSRPWQ